MPVADLLADDLLELDALTEDELLTVEADENEAQAILCSCCCSWCGC
ncbi:MULTISPECIES: hypothetical protein [Streptomyces]|uniref:Thiazolylpeptide-type bacteriocin n=2 Tax=Streptomyces TaxID=1883 RepID=A0A542U897_9ACTN|nr:MULTISPECIES: hypothetical protein [Streptomyces]MDX3639418.1 hypothetical protein [Streptomyces sp. MB09-02B]TQK95291.1 hypothetical protein FB563_0176 [Streptomyces puniciscabiei]WAZ24774.1 hypothetical protein STRCI_006225 [Streptomyces cinnabarinus]